MITPILQQQQLQDQILGKTFELGQIFPGMEVGRDLVFGNGPNGKDLVWVVGMDCLAQNLKMALTTALGSDIFNVNFGFDGLNALAEETNPVLQRERIRIAIIKVLQRDPRIRRIVDVRMVDGRLDAMPSGSLEIASSSAADAGRELSVTVSFEIVTGETLNINLGRLNPNV